MFPFSGHSQSEENGFQCGTVADPDSYLNDFTYANNDRLIDIIMEENIPIPEGYFEYLGIENPIDKSRAADPGKTYIPIKLWVYRNNNGSGNINTSQAYQIINELNNLFANNTNFVFYLLCDISFVNNSDYANNGHTHFNTYTLNNWTPKTLDVHVVISASGWAGRANFPFVYEAFGIEDRVFSCAVKIRSDFLGFKLRETAEVMAHEIGHVLGLYHTHHPGRNKTHSTNGACGDCYQESVSRTKTQGIPCVSTVGQKKCEVNGDFLCDTAADPLINFNVNNDIDCIYNGGGTDNWGDPWIPNGRNIMSYTLFGCMSYFSPMQVAKMVHYKNLMDISHPAFAISGIDFLCAGQTATFTVNSLPGVTNYHWEVSSNLNILSGQGTTSVTVQATNHGGGELDVTPNCGNRPIKKILTQLFSAPVSGPDTMCVGAAPKYYSTTSYPGATYNWSITNGTILNGQGTSMVQVSVSPHSSNLSEMYVSVNYCGSPFWGNKLITHVYSGTECNYHFPLSDNPEETILEAYEFIIYPNPAKNTFSVTATQGEAFTIEIADKNGTIIYKNNQTHIYETTINAEAFQTGIYFVIIKYGSQEQIKRVIIKK